MSSLKYQNGFGNYFISEAIEGAIPMNQNNPQKCPYGLIAEQLSGTAFTKPRQQNFKTYEIKIIIIIIIKKILVLATDSYLLFCFKKLFIYIFIYIFV